MRCQAARQSGGWEAAEMANHRAASAVTGGVFPFRLCLLGLALAWLIDQLPAPWRPWLVAGAIGVLGGAYYFSRYYTPVPTYAPSGAPVLPRRPWLPGAIGWAVVFWVTGLLVTPTLVQWASASDLWLKHLSDNPPQSFLLLLMIPVTLAAAAAVLALRVFVGCLVLAHRYYILPVLGFLVGLEPRIPSSFFVKTGQLLRGAAVDTGVSAVEVFTAKRRAHRLFALAVVLVAVGTCIFVYRLSSRVIPRSDAPIQQVERFRPTPQWRPTVSDLAQDFGSEVTMVEVEHDRVAVTLHFSNRGDQPFPLDISNHTTLQRVREQTYASRWAFVSGDDKRTPLSQVVMVAPHGSSDGTLYFGRPEDPYEQWMLQLEIIDRSVGRHGTMYFDLTRSSP